ncbi:MAG: hypothetical protein R3E84_12740 [Pseudomonadales bacterium]
MAEYHPPAELSQEKGLPVPTTASSRAAGCHWLSNRSIVVFLIRHSFHRRLEQSKDHHQPIAWLSRLVQQFPRRLAQPWWMKVSARQQFTGVFSLGIRQCFQT